MKVTNYKDFALFKYESSSCTNYGLGDIVLKESIEPTQAIIEIGVIIQVHQQNEYRTDMFGNCDANEIRLATQEEIEKYRPELREKVCQVF